MTLPLGLLSWLAAGVVAGLLARVVLPASPGSQRRMHLAAGLAVGVLGAAAGGTLATWLGFGGLVGYDVRAAVTAVLTAVFLLLLARALSLRYDVRPDDSGRKSP